MFLSGITFGLTNCSSLRNDPELSEYGMEMETLLECTQEMDKNTRKETKITFGPEESVFMEIDDTESSSDMGQENIGQKMEVKIKKSFSLREYFTIVLYNCFLPFPNSLLTTTTNSTNINLCNKLVC